MTTEQAQHDHGSVKSSLGDAPEAGSGPDTRHESHSKPSPDSPPQEDQGYHEHQDEQGDGQLDGDQSEVESLFGQLSPDELVAQGIDFHFNKEFQLASQYLSKASELMSEKYGDRNLRTVQVFYLYARSLINLHIASRDILGENDIANELKGLDDQGVEQQQVDGQLTATSSAVAPPQPKPGAFSITGDEEIERSPSPHNGQPVEPKSPSFKYDPNLVQDANDDLETAWQVLDVTRSTYERLISGDNNLELIPPEIPAAFECGVKGKGRASSAGIDPKAFQKWQDTNIDEWTAKLAEVYLMLGDVSIENEVYDQAAVDYQNALRVKQAINKPRGSPPTREMAEVHFKVGLALELSNMSAERAMQSYQASHDVLSRLVQTISNEAEKKEVEGLLKDVRTKIAEGICNPQREVGKALMDSIVKVVRGGPPTTTTLPLHQAVSAAEPVNTHAPSTSTAGLSGSSLGPPEAADSAASTISSHAETRAQNGDESKGEQAGPEHHNDIVNKRPAEPARDLQGLVKKRLKES